MCYASGKKHEKKATWRSSTENGTWLLDVTCYRITRQRACKLYIVKPPHGPQGKVNKTLKHTLLPPLKTNSLQGKGPFASAQLSLSRGREPSREGAERRSQSRDACPGSSQKTWSDHWKYNIYLRGAAKKKPVFFWEISPKSVYPPTHPRVFVRFGRTKGEIRRFSGWFCFF